MIRINNPEINFGDEAKDKVTGFKGLITSMHAYIDGCIQFGLSPPVDKNGEIRDTLQFDSARIMIVKKAKVEVNADPTGGPMGPGTSEPVR